MSQHYDTDVFTQIAEGIAERGYQVVKMPLPQQVVAQLKEKISSLSQDDMHQASIGRGNNKQLETKIRSDYICWLEQSDDIDNLYLQWMEELRQVMNRHLYMGLFDYEAHYAVYGAGDFYKKHLDALKGGRNRVLSTVFYLNHGWQAEDGGQLKLFSEKDQLLETLLPEYGTMVVFLSEEFPHEVMAANKERHSIAGWFRVSNSY